MSPARDGITRTATLSEDGVYRYALARTWGPGHLLGWVALNPSTADASVDDRTVGRMMEFTRREGYHGMLLVNLFAYRATDPDVLLTAPDPIGPGNAEVVGALAGMRVVAAWGASVPKLFAPEVPKMLDTLRALGCTVQCLGMTATGAPRHPLYVKGDTPMVSYP